MSASGRRRRHSRCANYGVSRVSIATKTQEPVGAGDASDAARSFAKLRVADEARGSPPARRNGFENGTLPERKGRPKESAHRGSTRISRMMGAAAFSDRTEFSVVTARE
jgi:hypothetical protein